MSTNEESLAFKSLGGGGQQQQQQKERGVGASIRNARGMVLVMPHVVSSCFQCIKCPPRHRRPLPAPLPTPFRFPPLPAPAPSSASSRPPLRSALWRPDLVVCPPAPPRLPTYSTPQSDSFLSTNTTYALPSPPAAPALYSPNSHLFLVSPLPPPSNHSLASPPPLPLRSSLPLTSPLPQTTPYLNPTFL